MYAKYVKEREDLDEIKTDKGFIHYKMIGESCIINDCFVLKEHRRSGHGHFLGDQVFELCKERGIKTVYCQSDTEANNHEISRQSILSFGFKEIEKVDTIYIYSMEVFEWERKSRT